MSSSVKVKEMSSAGHSERKSSPLHWWGVRTGLQNSKLPSATAFPGSQPTHAPLSLKFLLSIRLAGVNDWWWEQSQIVLQVFNSVRSKIMLYISPVPPFICYIVGMLLAKILSFSAQWSWMKNVETEFGGNRKVALIFSWWRGEHSRLLPQNLCLPPHHPATLRSLSPVKSLSRVWLFATPWTTARQTSVSITNCHSSPKLMAIESVMPSNDLILCHPLLLLSPIPPRIRVFSNESPLHIRWTKYWSFSFNISLSNEHP